MFAGTSGPRQVHRLDLGVARPVGYGLPNLWAGRPERQGGMAYEMQIRNSPGRAKIRSVWAVALLPIITLGIYLLVWWYKINRELRDYGDSKGYDLGQSPTNSLLALFPGGFIIIPPLVSYWRGTHRVQGAARLARTEPPNGWIALILYIILGLGFPAYLQYYLNHVWQADA